MRQKNLNKKKVEKMMKTKAMKMNGINKKTIKVKLFKTMSSN